MRISSKRQISFPKKLMEALALKPGDEVELEIEGNAARLIPIKTIKVPRGQAWFWMPEWQEQEMEREQHPDLSAGPYRDFENTKDLLKELHSED